MSISQIELSNLTLDDLLYLDPLLLDGDGIMKLHLARFYRDFPHSHLRLWGGQRARYQYPTVELIEWLKAFIGNRTAIEIGAGQGDLGRHMGIHMTDNYSQQRPEMQRYYGMLRQAITNPPPIVEKIDALEAIDKYKPKVVIGAFITQRAYESDNGTNIGSNFYGPEEFDILAADSVEAYVHIGNVNTHGDKRILKVKHKEHHFDWLVNRTKEPSLNRIWVWGG